MKKNNPFPYQDIIDLPHHKSATREPMPTADRAAQFAPFAALTGYNAAVEETARYTEEQPALTEHAKEALNHKLQYILEHLSERPEATFTYFVPDKRKPGGAHTTKSGIVKTIQKREKVVVLEDHTTIPIKDILQIEGALFDPAE